MQNNEFEVPNEQLENACYLTDDGENSEQCCDFSSSYESEMIETYEIFDGNSINPTQEFSEFINNLIFQVIYNGFNLEQRIHSGKFFGKFL